MSIWRCYNTPCSNVEPLLRGLTVLVQQPIAQVPEDIPLNEVTSAVLHVSDPHFSVSALLMYGIVYQQVLILAHLEVLPA